MLFRSRRIVDRLSERYVIDHHHLARALQEEGVENVLTTVVADLHDLEKDAFWVVADHRAWVHPYDSDGVRRDVGDLPKRIEDLADDPFRSLAGELRRAGGFAKDTTPFSEFLWADFLRRRIKRKDVKDDFSDALEEALALARSSTSRASPNPYFCIPARSACPGRGRVNGALRARSLMSSSETGSVDITFSHFGHSVLAITTATGPP